MQFRATSEPREGIRAGAGKFFKNIFRIWNQRHNTNKKSWILTKLIMRNYIAYFVMVAPIIAYNIYCFATNVPNSGIDFGKVIISFFLGIISYNLGMKIKNKGKVE